MSGMRLRIRHVTRFSYDQPAYESHNEARLQPSENSTQQCLSFELLVNPEAAIFASRDYFGNHVHSISLAPRHQSLTIIAESTVERLPADEDSADDVAFFDFLREDLARERSMYEFLNPSRYIPFSGRLRKFFWSSRPDPAKGVAEYVMRTIKFIRDQFEYETGTTDVHSDSDRMLTTGGGVCQDFAHLSIGVLRLAGVPARYVSGYLAENIASEYPLREQASHAHGWRPGCQRRDGPASTRPIDAAQISAT